MKVSIHLTKASRGMTLRNVELDTALALCAALRGLPGVRIDAEIVAETPPVMQGARTGARRHGAARRASHTLRHSLVRRSTDAS
ncbi:MAG TPA: hypothetical protein VFL86_26895 [Burkholderiaceae bacterium]|nr:hypothetical protein [Burkholderiaceae bacterium]